MMTIGSMTGADSNRAAGYSGMNMQSDSVCKNIQKQIANAQKKMQELSSNEELAPEEKMKKRQEIQQEISSLNQQLRQRQMELKKEQQKEGSSMDDMLGTNQRAAKNQGSTGGGLSQAGMQAVISADASMKQARVQGSAAVRMKDRAGVLESEIKMDKGKGTERKEAELADMERKAANAVSSQMHTLADANQAMKEAAEAEQDSKVEKAGSKAEKAGAKAGSKADAAGTKADKAESRADAADTKTGTGTDTAGKSGQGTNRISENHADMHVDIRL